MKPTYLILLALILMLGACAPADRDHFYTADTSDLEASVADLEHRLAIIEVARDAEVRILSIIDPCSDGNGVDEVILKTSEGLLAWVYGTGLVLLDDGTYRTTDAQGCLFEVSDGNLNEVEEN